MAASETYRQLVQKALNTCPDHEHMEIEMYCKTCKKPVCTKCVKENHRDHDWDTMATVARELRKQTSQSKMELESMSKSIIVGTEEVLDFHFSERDIELNMNCILLETERKRLLESVNKCFDKMKSQCKMSHKIKINPLEEDRRQLESKRKRINFLIQNMWIGAGDYTDYDLIELHKEIFQLLTDLQALSVFLQGQRERLVYRPGSLDMKSVESLVGKVEVDQSAPEVKFENEFILSDTFINAIHLMSEKEAWIHPSKSTFIHLIDSSGAIKQTINLGCLVYNFTVSDEGGMYFCDHRSSTVKQIDKLGVASSPFSTAPLIPEFISLTRSGDLLITLVDKHSLCRNSSSRRLLRRTSITGVVIKEYEYDNDGKTPLFCLPARPIELPNGNICIINIYQDNKWYYIFRGKNYGTLYGLHFINNVIFRYDGIGGDFNPSDICFDSKSNIFILDWNKKVHVLDSNGKFVRFLLNEYTFTENLYALSFYGSKLWIGMKQTGLVKVFDLKL